MLTDESLDILFRKARTHRNWLPKPVSDDLLRELYDVVKWGPTSGNCCPARILFLRTPEAKERLRPALAAANVDKTMNAPVTAIIAYDLKFYDRMPKLSPYNPRAREEFSQSPEFQPAAPVVSVLATPFHPPLLGPTQKSWGPY